MTGYELPLVKNEPKLILEHFPTQMQAVVFRMWDMVPKAKLAQIMETSEENIEKLANGLGLTEQNVHPDWLNKGYITIIRSAWHILPYEQLLDILGWDADKLAYILKEDDFLNLKLGDFKPDCPRVIYRELTDDEEEKTKEFLRFMKESVTPFSTENAKKPFDLFCNCGIERIKISEQPNNTVKISDKWAVSNMTNCEETDFYTDLFLRDFSDLFGYSLCGGSNAIELYVKEDISDEEEYFEIDVTQEKVTVTAAQSVGLLRGLMHIIRTMRKQKGPYIELGHFCGKPAIKSRIIYSFCGLYTNAFETEPEISYPEELLRAYARMGINGVFAQLLLYNMAEFPFDTAVSEGWQARLERVKQTVAHLKKYGIKLYFYFNEPRSLALQFFEKYPQLKGFEYDGYAHMCTSAPEVQKYLDEAIYGFCREVPDIGGFLITTRSENHTNCYSHIYPYNSQNCPRCIKRKPQEVIAEVCNIVNRAAKRANPKILTVAATWEWMSIFNENSLTECLEILDKDIPLERVSEEASEFVCGGVENKVVDYTMSKPAPSKASLDIWNAGIKTGHEAMAKVQINNTWECSTVPYIPVYDYVWQHISGLKDAGIRHLMLSWTLGGYPSPTLELISDLYFDITGKTVGYKEGLEGMYGEYADCVQAAAGEFSEAFAEFPFDVQTAYLGPHNASVSNLLYKSPTGQQSTMTCYCYDNLEDWRSKYPVEVYENQHRIMHEKWHNGMKHLENMPDCEFKDIAEACDHIWATCYNQIRYIILRDEYLKTANKALIAEILKILKCEAELAQRYYVLMQKNPAIGYEAANHYYYNQSMITEKIISCRQLEKQWQKQL